jgi:signal transduction histidine kinase/ligand-binding sensor domain-containing protein
MFACVVSMGAEVAQLPIETGLADTYLRSVWTGEEGLPGGIANSIVQTPDGFIWLATFAGVARFDGTNFKLFDPINTPEMASERIVRLCPDREGRIWAISEFGHVTRFSANGVRGFAAADGLTNRIGFVREDFQGRLWAAENGKRTNYYRIEGDRFIPVAGSEPMVNRFGNKQARDGHGWYDDPDGINMTTGEEKKKYFLPKELSPSRNSHIATGRTDGAWLVTDRAIFRLRNAQWEIMTTNGPVYNSLGSAAEDDFGNLWIGDWNTGLSVFTMADRRVHGITLNENGRPEAIRDIFVDRDGDVWVAADTSGLFRFKKRLFKAIDSRSGLASDVARSISGDGAGNVWVCTTAGVNLLRPSGTKWSIDRRFPEIDLPWNVFAERENEVWIGTWGKRLRHFDGAKLNTILEPELDRHEFALMTSFFLDSHKQLWAGASTALYRSEDGKHFSFFELPQVGHNLNVRAFAETSGAFFVGSNGQGLFENRGGEWIRIGENEGLTTDRVSALAADRAGALWIGTVGTGLFRYANGRAVRIDEPTLPKSITGILEDDFGNLWLGGDGIWRASLAALNAHADRRAPDVPNTRFDRSDGLPSSACIGGTQPSVFKSADGKLWFPTMHGVAIVDPRTLSQEHAAPFVKIEVVKRDGQNLPLRIAATNTVGFGRGWRQLDPIVIRKGSEQLEFQFTSPEMVAPEKVRFRYRLEGHDSMWLDGTSGREARYSRLAPGQYLFRVVAADHNGFFHKRGAAILLTVEPFYWQTTWFKCLIVAFSGAVLIAAYRYSVWRQSEISRLRLRIASDLHDEVGSNLGSIALKAEMLQSTGAGVTIERCDLADINAVALRTANDVRDVAWFINPDFDTLSEMSARMREVAGRMLIGLDWKFDCSDGADRKLSLEFRRNVFFIFKEILHNIVKHSQATEIRMQAHDDGKIFILEIQDNGIGCSGETAGGQGLRNMRRRVKEIGGRVEFQSAPGAGARVRLEAAFRTNWFAHYDK